ncbi:PLP-dependent aminotransferase family protein [Brevibacterium sp. BRM-1]|uniref:aminotransferase-like domain-containing protein n=1 Tax=Brevibacterium sp. BRM-1 TaxID=2999062 RepID=UPI00227DDD90|nr:PLP-dependent aminotransferase family protein [Brevibacterium sp. BRM-1]WAL39223.1 PLP-dependent aminotransferase family protein [Brevibacterium sp. BRM-1]
MSTPDWFGRLAERAQAGPSELSAVLALAGSGGDLVDFSGGFPDPELFDTRLLAELAAKAIETRPEVALQYASNRGLPGLREALRADFARTQSRTPADDELIVTSGGVDAMTLISKAMLDPGDGVLVEAPSYLGAFSVFRSHEGVCVSMRNDEHGLIPASLAEAAADARARGIEPKFAYVIPDFQNPSGLLLSAERRREIVDTARAEGLLVLEDVAYRDLAFDGSTLPSIYELGPDVTVQVGTFSKTFSPGTRLGWAAGPAQVIDAMAQAKTNTDQCAGALGQCMLESLMREGHYARALPHLQRAYGTRAQALMAALDEHVGSMATWTRPAGGFFTWLDVPGVDTKLLAPVAIDAGVAFVPGAPFFADPGAHSQLRLSFSRTPTGRMGEGARRLAAAIGSQRG